MGLSGQGAGADLAGHEQAEHQAAAASCQSPSHSPGSCMGQPGQSCSVAESSCSFRLPPDSPQRTPVRTPKLAGVSGELRWEEKLYVFNP